MHSPTPKPLEDIEQSIELLSPIDALKDGGMHPGIHTTTAKVLVLFSVLLFTLSFVNPVFGVLAFGAFCLAIPITLIGEVLASIRSGELRVSLTAQDAIRHTDLRSNKYPRVVIRRSERPIRFWFYQGLYVFFGLSPIFIILFLYAYALSTK